MTEGIEMSEPSLYIIEDANREPIKLRVRCEREGPREKLSPALPFFSSKEKAQAFVDAEMSEHKRIIQEWTQLQFDDIIEPDRGRHRMNPPTPSARRRSHHGGGIVRHRKTE
jgi:hypothetical protein